jgi:hypothetical protein
MRGIPGQIIPFGRDTNGEVTPQLNVKTNETTVAVFGKSVAFDCSFLFAQVQQPVQVTDPLGILHAITTQSFVTPSPPETPEARKVKPSKRTPTTISLKKEEKKPTEVVLTQVRNIDNN